MAYSIFHVPQSISQMLPEILYDGKVLLSQTYNSFSNIFFLFLMYLKEAGDLTNSIEPKYTGSQCLL